MLQALLLIGWIDWNHSLIGRVLTNVELAPVLRLIRIIDLSFWRNKLLLWKLKSWYHFRGFNLGFQVTVTHSLWVHRWCPFFVHPFFRHFFWGISGVTALPLIASKVDWLRGRFSLKTCIDWNLQSDSA